MPLPGALLDSDDDDMPSSGAASIIPHAVAPTGFRAGPAYNDESAAQQSVGQGRPLSSIQATDSSAASEDAARNVRARTEALGVGTATPSMASSSTPMALSRTPSTGWGVGLVAVTPVAAAATPTAAPAALVTAKVLKAASPQGSPKSSHRPSQVKVEPLSRTGSSEGSELGGSDSDGGEGLSKGILADRIESVQREIDLLNAEIQVPLMHCQNL